MNKQKIKKLFQIFVARFKSAEITTTPVLVAYYILLGLFPLLIVIGNILPYLHIEPVVAIEYIEIVVPEPVQPILVPLVESLLNDSSGSLLSLGALGLLWSATKGINYLQIGMNKVYGVPTEKSFIAKRVISVLTILLILLFMLAFVLVFAFGESLLSVLAPHFTWAEIVHSLMSGLKWPVTLVFMFCILSLVYVIVPDVKVRIRDALPGAALSTVGLLLLTEAFAIYVRFANKTFSSYGALSSFFVLMFWLNFSATIILAGAVLNAAIHEYLCGEPEQQENEIDNLLEKKIVNPLKRFFKKHEKEE